MAKVIFGPYFTKKIKFPQHDSSNNGKGGSKPDDYNQMKVWYESVKRIKVNAIIFHNELSLKFTKKHETPKIKFSCWNKHTRPSYNDERFVAYRKMLRKHPEFDFVFMTDLYDVKFIQNPFELVEKNLDYDLFLGSENLSKFNSKWMVQKSREMKIPLIKNKYAPGSIAYNAGIIGGSRKILLLLLDEMVKYFKNIHPKYNANMPVYNLAVEKLSKDYKIFTGFPLHNRFRSKKVPPGVFIKHK